MKILLTGANGFIGSHLVKKLLEENHTLIVLKRVDSNLSRIKEYSSLIKFYEFEDQSSMQDIFIDKIDTVIHLAGVYIKNDTSRKDIQRINKFNIDTASQLAYIASQKGVTSFINTGTFFEYDLYSQDRITEESLKMPFNYYAASKVAFEQLLEYFCHTSMMKGITLRLFSPYGEMDNEKVIPLIIKSALSKKELTLMDSTQTLSFTYIDDIVEAYVKALSFNQKMKSRYESFNIAANEAYSIREVVDCIRTFTKEDLPISFNPAKVDGKKTISIRCDTTKSKKILNWQAKTSLSIGLKRTYEYYKKVI